MSVIDVSSMVEQPIERVCYRLDSCTSNPEGLRLKTDGSKDQMSQGRMGQVRKAVSRSESRENDPREVDFLPFVPELFGVPVREGTYNPAMLWTEMPDGSIVTDKAAYIKNHGPFIEGSESYKRSLKVNEERSS